MREAATGQVFFVTVSECMSMSVVYRKHARKCMRYTACATLHAHEFPDTKLLSRASNSLPHQPYSSRLNEYRRSNGNTVPKEDEITRGKMVMRIGRDGWDTAGG